MKKYIKTCWTLFLFCLFSLTMFAQERTSEIQWLNYPSSFGQLMHHFKDKVVYIDIMASWCKPCLEELNEYEKTKEFFDTNNIVRLFISIDQSDNWKKCLKQLDEHQLKGYLVTYTRPDNSVEYGTFSTEVEKLFITHNENGNPSLSIPRFIIVNKEGVIVEYKAKRPSNPVELKQQLEQYLK